MLASEFDWSSGHVTVWELDDLDPNRPLADQKTTLKEDLAQIEYPYDVTLDVGWYVDAFVIVVVYGSDWDKPALRVRADLSSLSSELHKAIQFADELAASIA